MPKPLSFGKIEVGLTAGEEASSAISREGAPFRILILGDFSGRANQGLEARFLDRKPIRVDRDNFAKVMAKLGPSLRLPFLGENLTDLSLTFKELDDFLPDAVYRRADIFEKLRDLRKRLDNPSSFAAAAAELRRDLAVKTEAVPPAAAPKQSEVPAEPANLLEQMLGGKIEPSAAPQRFPGGNWQAYLQKLVEPHLLPKLDQAEQADLLGLVDSMTSRQMRLILHDHDFQALEATWRGFFFLLRRLDTDNGVQLHLFDLSKTELAIDLGATDELTETGLYRLLVEQTVGTQGGQPWAVLTGLYTFDQSLADVELLGRVAKVAEQAGAPFLSAAADSVLGCKSLGATPEPNDWYPSLDADGNERWDALRNLPQATSLGLALPRFLLRLPYGKNTSEVEAFDFEELPGPADHEGYLWGNPAVACVYLLAEAFNRHGWNLRPGVSEEVGGLPAHVYEEDGESTMKPCAEAILSNRALDVILAKGLMPLVSIKGRDAVRLARFQSVAAPAQALSGGWG